jgi:crotonobetaine/carnitine-CoA ligase
MSFSTNPNDALDATDDDVAVIATDPANLLLNRLADWARRDPDRPFLTEVNGPTLTFGEFETAMRRWMTWLRQQGIGPGDRVASLLPGSLDAYLLWLATAALRAYEVAVSPDLRGPFLRHVFTDSKARLVVARPADVAMVREAAPDVVIAAVASEHPEIDACPPADPPDPVTGTDVACVIYTSGTTGDAKGVVISFGQLATIIGRMPRSWLDEDHVVYACWPMSHVTGRSPAVTMADVGGQIVVRDRFSLQEFWDDVRRYNCTSCTVGSVVPLLLAAPPSPADKDHPLEWGWYGAMGTVAIDFQERFGVRPLSSYGSTEVGFPVAHRWVTADNVQLAGYLRRGYELKIVDPVGNEVPFGEPGELWLKPPARHLVLLEYLDRPELTARATADGWYHTGDAVRQEPDGGIRFVDRLTDTIRRFGENISASALQEAIQQEPDVSECAVLGLPSPVSGQEVFLAVVPADPDFDVAAFWQRLRDRLPRFMLPARILVTDELPRSPNGKVRKRVLADDDFVARAWQAPSVRRSRADAESD